jgi:bifunctional non-homologous end joining protein LigD
VAGWHRTPGRELRSLLLGYYNGGKLIFGGKAGTGFGLAVGGELAERLRKIERDTPPFASVPRAYQSGSRWVDPRLVAEVTFTTWTTDNLLRHPSFEGLREDKSAREVKFERPSHKAS